MHNTKIQALTNSILHTSFVLQALAKSAHQVLSAPPVFQARDMGLYQIRTSHPFCRFVNLQSFSPLFPAISEYDCLNYGYNSPTLICSFFGAQTMAERPRVEPLTPISNAISLLHVEWKHIGSGLQNIPRPPWPSSRSTGSETYK